MKKFLLGIVVLLMGTAVMTSCSDDDGSGVVIKPYSNGAYVCNAGNKDQNIDGSISYLNYANNQASQRLFFNANGRSLGGTVNDGLVYGSKAYIISTDENTIEVVDKRTFRSIKQIKTTELLGDVQGKSPRHIISGYGNIYVTTYGGVVAAIDTLSFSLQKKYEVGSYPEGLAGYGNTIAVANSDYGYGNGTLSIINLQSGEVTTKAIEGVVNPVKMFFSNSGSLYVLDSGSYDASWNQVGAGLKQISNRVATDVVACTMACFDGGTTFYYINAPYGATTTAYGAFNVLSNQKLTWNPTEKPESPSEIAVDPVEGSIYVLSWVLGDYGYADYSANGYGMRYNTNGVKIGKFDTGVGPTAMFFDSGYVVE